MQMYVFDFRIPVLQFLMLLGDRRRNLNCKSTWLLFHNYSLLVLQCISSLFVFILNISVGVATLYSEQQLKVREIKH